MPNKTQVINQKCRIIELPKIYDARGNLTFIESNNHIPFSIKRIFYLYDVPGGESRAGHALKTCQQFIIAVSGSFDVLIDDGKSREKYSLNQSYYGLFVPALLWRELENFSSGSVCLVIASENYEEQGYYRDYQDYKKAVLSRI